MAWFETRSLLGLDDSHRVSIDAKLLETKDALKNLDGLYIDEFIR